MNLDWKRDIVVESWVDLGGKAASRYEIDELNEFATLYFGQYEEFVLHLDRSGVRSVATLAADADAQLTDVAGQRADADGQHADVDGQRADVAG